MANYDEHKKLSTEWKQVPIINFEIWFLKINRMETNYPYLILWNKIQKQHSCHNGCETVGMTANFSMLLSYPAWMSSDHISKSESCSASIP